MPSFKDAGLLIESAGATLLGDDGYTLLLVAGFLIVVLLEIDGRRYYSRELDGLPRFRRDARAYIEARYRFSRASRLSLRSRRPDEVLQLPANGLGATLARSLK